MSRGRPSQAKPNPQSELSNGVPVISEKDPKPSRVTERNPANPVIGQSEVAARLLEDAVVMVNRHGIAHRGIVPEDSSPHLSNHIHYYNNTATFLKNRMISLWSSPVAWFCLCPVIPKVVVP